jgi:hypothetical protein
MSHKKREKEKQRESGIISSILENELNSSVEK